MGLASGRHMTDSTEGVEVRGKIVEEAWCLVMRAKSDGGRGARRGDRVATGRIWWCGGKKIVSAIVNPGIPGVID